MPMNKMPGARVPRARLAGLSLAFLALILTALGSARAEQVPPAPPRSAVPVPVKVVVVTMYEIGKLTGDKPGEAQFWVERQKLDRALPFPLGEYELRMNDAGL